jgi:putative DNA primase/helicase
MSDPIIEDDYHVIPDGLKDRSQWLLWDASADSPRRPHWKGDFGVSWTDPADWQSFKEVVEAADSTDSWGIGYVFSDLGPYTSIDIDACLNTCGGPKDWVPSLAPLLGETYIEVSASGTGLHVILDDYQEPAWWHDTDFSDDEHEGVEVYEQKFCEFTGSPIEPSGRTVGDVDVTDWLIEAYKSINGEDPTERHRDEFDSASEGGRAQRDEFLDKDDIRDALEAIDPDVSYSVWRDIGFALKGFLR